MIYEEIRDNLDNRLYQKLKSKRWHLGVFSEPYLSYMMDGTKTIESRFSKDKRAPYSKIDKDDVVFIKKSSGPVIGYFTIRDIKFFELDREEISYIKKNYSIPLAVSDDFFIEKKDSKYATLIFIEKVMPLNPFRIHKKGMASWIALD